MLEKLVRKDIFGILCLKLWSRSNLKLAKCWKSHIMFMLPSIQWTNSKIDHQLFHFHFTVQLEAFNWQLYIYQIYQLV